MLTYVWQSKNNRSKRWSVVSNNSSVTIQCIISSDMTPNWQAPTSLSEVKYSLIYQNVITDSAPLELAPFNPRSHYETDANILSHQGNRNGDWRSRGRGRGRYERSLLRSDRMTAPEMSICQREMKRRPVGFCYRRTGQPVWKISSKSFSVASLIHEKIFFSSCYLFSMWDVSLLN